VLDAKRGIKQSHFIKVQARWQVQGKTVTLKPGEYSLTGFGSGVSADGSPKRCLTCRRLIRRGERWVSIDNGQYKVIRHRSCAGVDTNTRS